MCNIIDVQINFSFKGIEHSPKITINLDETLQATGRLPSLRQQVVNASEFGAYSYEQEVMESMPLTTTLVSGTIAQQCINEDKYFDSKQFIQQWKEQQRDVDLHSIAKKRLNISNLNDNQHAAIKLALVDAYTLSQEQV
ncbi:MAG: hypothetical protein KAH22_08005 [Thiotrichaceae bacterium]|nr:hypothetical protein [Thiotrichaceae bacterium]